MVRSSLSSKTFQRVSEFIYAELGIKMPEGKKTMLEGRLGKRMRALGIDTHEAYCDYVFSEEPSGSSLALYSRLLIATGSMSEKVWFSPAIAQMNA